jgi:hypothetical protein
VGGSPQQLVARVPSDPGEREEKSRDRCGRESPASATLADRRQADKGNHGGGPDHQHDDDQ